MGVATAFQPHKQIVPALATSEFSPTELQALVAGLFGEVDFVSESIPFSFTHYYDEELGPSIYRMLFSIGELVDPALLAEHKQRANAIEAETARPDGRRVINLDPGLLSLSRVILATTKASGHRIPLRDAIHAEITLIFRHGRYQPLDWTYPDFRSEAYQEWLLQVRETYHQQLRRLDPARSWRL